MHSIRQNVDDSIYDRLIGLLQILPKDKVEILSDSDNSISFEEAKHKVARAANNVLKQEGLDLDTAIEKILNS
ncbi:MAG: hypothetical protein PHW64_03530 [Sulfuricurvum sp.]|nr:hypothetical protein [Sulfuricurvum sp.]